MERALHIKFPGEISRAEEAGFVSDILFVCVASNTVYVQISNLYVLILYIPAGPRGQT